METLFPLLPALTRLAIGLRGLAMRGSKIDIL